MIPQPKDRNDPLYRTLDRLLVYGDQAEIARKKRVELSTVCSVVRGHRRSRKIWSAVMELVMERKAQQIEVNNYLNS